MTKNPPRKNIQRGSAAAAGPGSPGWFPRVGDVWPGQGIYAGIMRGEPGLPDHHLFMTADPAGFHDRVAWGAYGTDEPHATSQRDGYANTMALLVSKHDHPAARWAAGLEIQGLSDWYLPSRFELRLCSINCGEILKAGWYWSSTQYSAHDAWGQDVPDGGQTSGAKGLEGRAVAVRRLLIE